MALRLVAYPNRLTDCYLTFGWRPERMSRFVSATLRFIYQQWWFLLEFDTQRLVPEKLRQYADTIKAKGCPLTNCWGFIDGSPFYILRPGKGQRTVYNGHKRKHYPKYLNNTKDLNSKKLNWRMQTW